MRTTDEIRQEINTLEAELAALSGEGLDLWDGRCGKLADRPPGGATLHVQWAISDSSYDRWYPTVEQAKAKLLEIARNEGRMPDASGFSVDLTAPGCHTSQAYITRHDDGEVTPRKTLAGAVQIIGDLRRALVAARAVHATDIGKSYSEDEDPDGLLDRAREWENDDE